MNRYERNVSQKLRQAARGQACVRCGVEDGTTVLAHYRGPRRHSYGGGLGHKGHDLIGAHLCHACHVQMDTTLIDRETRWERSEEFLHLVALTLINLWEREVLK